MGQLMFLICNFMLGAMEFRPNIVSFTSFTGELCQDVKSISGIEYYDYEIIVLYTTEPYHSTDAFWVLKMLNHYHFRHVYGEITIML